MGAQGTVQPVHCAFEGPAIEWLKEASQKAVAGRLGLNWNKIHGIMERALRSHLGRSTSDRPFSFGQIAVNVYATSGTEGIRR